MDPIFKHLVFDSAREKVKRVIRKLEKSQEALENSKLTLVSNMGATMYFPLQNRWGLLMRGRLYSTSAEIATINGGMDDNVKGEMYNTMNFYYKYASILKSSSNKINILILPINIGEKYLKYSIYFSYICDYQPLWI